MICPVKVVVVAVLVRVNQGLCSGIEVGEIAMFAFTYDAIDAV
jgi:hypothetical protein